MFIEKDDAFNLLIKSYWRLTSIFNCIFLLISAQRTHFNVILDHIICLSVILSLAHLECPIECKPANFVYTSMRRCLKLRQKLVYFFLGGRIGLFFTREVRVFPQGPRFVPLELITVIWQLNAEFFESA